MAQTDTNTSSHRNPDFGGLILEGGVLTRDDACCALEEVIVPDGVVCIDNGCFAGSDSLRRVALPQSLREIGVGAFMDCRNLEDIAIPAGVKRLRKQVFSGCERLEELVVPEGVTSIGEWAFRDCSSLREVVLPTSVEDVCAESFLECPNLVLCAPAGSYAEEYARKFGLRFVEATPATDSVACGQANESALERDDAWEEAYGKYFMGRTVANIMEEWSEHHDEWR